MDNQNAGRNLGLHHATASSAAIRKPEMEIDGLVPQRFPRWKRTLDLACALVSLPCWLPLLAVLGLVIKFADSGPILFRQQRIGYRGKPFSCLKLRTMKTDAETGSHEALLDRLIKTHSPMTKLDATGDPRLIPFGRFLRATGLDELPQIFNVIRGEMSLVGPRPGTPFEYERCQAAQKARVNVPPGLTGYWQVNGKNKTTFGQMIDLDIYYAKNISPWLDIKILFRTLPAIATQVYELWARAKYQHRADKAEVE